MLDAILAQRKEENRVSDPIKARGSEEWFIFTGASDPLHDTGVSACRHRQR